MLLISFELDEIFGLSDRILVMYEGAITLETRRRIRPNESELGLAMTGGASCAERRRRRRESSSDVSSGALFPLVTVVIAFVLGGLVVILVGANPFTVYKQLAVGAGLDWPFQYLPGHPVHVDPVVSEINLTHTLAYATPLVLTGLAVGFAFRCGLFAWSREEG